MKDNKGYNRVCCVSFVLFCVGIVYVSVGVFCRSGEGVVWEIWKVGWVNRCSVGNVFGAKIKAG